MLIRPVHSVPDLAEVHSMVRSTQLGVLTTGIASSSYPFLQSTHIPWVLDVDPSGLKEDGTPDLGTLRGHIARQNPQSKAMVEAVKEGGPEEEGELQDEVLVLFTLPNHAYVAPHWWTETKPKTQKVVPTWNYEAVQVYGRLTVRHGGEPADAFLSQQIRDLSHQGESSIGHTGPGEWKVEDAPAPYINQLKRVIVGLEIKITRIEGKSKMSQEERLPDRIGIAAGFEAQGTEVSKALAEKVRQRSDEKEAAKAA
ncbi:hypothetical protein JCM8097_004563 [Rhodosporidiobolus ruineniae]